MRSEGAWHGVAGMTFRDIGSVAFGTAMLALIVSAVLDRIIDVPGAAWVMIAAAAIALALAMGEAPMTRRSVLVIAVFLAIAVIADLGPAAPAVLERAATAGAFLGAFFAGVGALRMVSQHSQAMLRCAAILVTRPQSQRYVALSLGSFLFSTVLNFGALSLLGGMAMRASENLEGADLRERDIRDRRVLMALLRGFGAFLMTAPTAFSFAIVLSLVPDVQWWRILPLSFLAAMIFLAVGWCFDRFTGAGPETRSFPPRAWPQGNISAAAVPLMVLGLTVLGAVIVETVFDTTLPEAVMATVPFVVIGWVLAQAPGGPLARLGELHLRARHMLGREFYEMRGEIAFVMLLGLVSTMLAALADANIPTADLIGSGLPAWAIVGAIMATTVIAGQVGVNPIVAIAVLGNLLPEPAAMGLTPVAFALTLLVSWSLAGGSSGTVASTHIISALARRSVTTVTLRWNGPFVLAAAVVLVFLIVLINLLAL